MGYGSNLKSNRNLKQTSSPMVVGMNPVHLQVWFIFKYAGTLHHDHEWILHSLHYKLLSPSQACPMIYINQFTWLQRKKKKKKKERKLGNYAREMVLLSVAAERKEGAFKYINSPLTLSSILRSISLTSTSNSWSDAITHPQVSANDGTCAV